VSNPLKKLAGQTMIYGLGTILPRFLNYFLTPILTYAFSAAEYGINGQLFAIISFLNIIFLFGMETTFFNFYSKNENKHEVYNNAILMLLVTSAIMGSVLILFSDSIAQSLSTPSVTYLPQFVVWCVIIIVSDAIMAVPFAKMRSDNQPLKFSLIKIINVLINAGLTVFFVLVCKPAYEHGEGNLFSSMYNPEIGIGYCFLSMAIANGVTLLLLSKQFISVKLNLNKELMLQMLKYTWPLIILGLAGMVNETLDRIILKELMLDKDAAQIALGIYSGCYKIAILMTIFIQAFRFAVEPFFFSQAADKNSKKLYAIIMKYFVIFCSFLFLGTMMNLEWIQYLVDEEYRAGLNVVPILLMANLCLGVVYNLSIWYKLSQKTGYGAIIAIIGAVVTIVINVAFVPQYGFTACAWATLAAYGTMMVVSYFLGQKQFPIKYNIRAISVFVIIALGFYGLSLTYQGLDNVILKLLLNNLFVILFAWLFYKLEFSNLKNVKNQLQS